MLEVVIVLAIIALVLLFLRAGRQNTIVYRKRVAPPDRSYSIRDHPSVFSPPPSSDHYSDHETEAGRAIHEPFAFEGGEFGGGGAGDSYDTGESDFNSYDTDFNSYDSGTNDSGSSDPCSDSSSDNSGFSSD